MAAYRIGGLAVALGIGSAVVAGHGIAAADTPDGSTGASSTESSAEPEKTTAPVDSEVPHPQKKGSKLSHASANADHSDVASTRKTSSAPTTRKKPAADRPSVTADSPTTDVSVSASAPT